MPAFIKGEEIYLEADQVFGFIPSGHALNVTIMGAGGFSENVLNGSPGVTQGGTYSTGTAIPFTFTVYGVTGGQYVIASCTGVNNNTALGSPIFSITTGTNIGTLNAQFSWTPSSPGTYYVQCRAQYVPSHNPGVTGGPQGGIGTTGEILFNVN